MTVTSIVVTGGRGPTGPIGPQGEPGDPGGPAGPAGPPGPIGNTIVDNLDGGVFTLNPFNGTDYTLTITAPTTLAASGLTNNCAMTATIVQDGVGGHALTLPSSWIGAADFTLNTVAGEYDILVVWRSPLGIHVKRVHQGELPSTIWTPQNLANQRCWYNANSIPLEAGELVTGWANTWTAKPDLAAPGNAPTLRIVNGEKYIECEGANSEALEVNFGGGANVLSQPLTIATLHRVNGTGTQHIINGGSGFNNNSTEIHVADSPQNYYVGGNDLNTLTTNGDWQIAVLQANGASPNSKLRVDGTEVATGTGVLTLQGVRLARHEAGTAYSTIDYAEVIVFNHLPNSTELANLEQYLSVKRDALNGII